jgi:hypothetical protein
MGNLRIGPYLAFVSKFWAVEDVITRCRTASGHVDGAGLATCETKLMGFSVVRRISSVCVFSFSNWLRKC